MSTYSSIQRSLTMIFGKDIYIHIILPYIIHENKRNYRLTYYEVMRELKIIIEKTTDDITLIDVTNLRYLCKKKGIKLFYNNRSSNIIPGNWSYSFYFNDNYCIQRDGNILGVFEKNKIFPGRYKWVVIVGIIEYL